MGKIGRNDPCPCGSGKKYKHCHGKLSLARDPAPNRMAVNLSPPLPEDLLPVKGVKLGITESGIRKPGARICS